MRVAIETPTTDCLQVAEPARCRRPGCARLYRAAQRALERDQAAARAWLAEHPAWDLAFVRERATMTVHVKPLPIDPPTEIAWGDGQAFAAAALRPMRMLCGRALHVDPFGEGRPAAQAYPQGSVFADDDLLDRADTEQRALEDVATAREELKQARTELQQAHAEHAEEMQRARAHTDALRTELDQARDELGGGARGARGRAGACGGPGPRAGGGPAPYDNGRGRARGRPRRDPRRERATPHRPGRRAGSGRRGPRRPGPDRGHCAGPDRDPHRRARRGPGGG